MSQRYLKTVYAARPETPVLAEPDESGRRVNVVLMGTWLGVTKEQGNWMKVVTAGPDGWVRSDDTADKFGMKIFFIDVGQGDSVLIETPVKRYLVDGGPSRGSCTYRYLRSYQYSYLIRNKARVHFNGVFITHFDADHYAGLLPLMRDESFEIDTIYHNGIARFLSKSSERPAVYDTDLGETGQLAGEKVLRTTFSSISDAKALLKTGGLQSTFRTFLEAVLEAHRQGRVRKMLRLTIRNRCIVEPNDRDSLAIHVLGPVPSTRRGLVHYRWFSDSSHTRNGHSLILRLERGDRSVLLGGDLNAEAEEYLLNNLSRPEMLKVDVAKSCHHGSSDFSISFMKALSPFATVISSGDNESYAHPRADALGAAGRYSRGRSPLVFSTELARSYGKAEDILYGMINLRTDGKSMVMAQMKEQRTGSDVWDSYELP